MNREDAEDLTQETFIALWEKRESIIIQNQEEIDRLPDQMKKVYRLNSESGMDTQQMEGRGSGCQGRD